MRDEIIEAMWEFANAVSHTCLNKKLNASEATTKNKEDARDIANRIIQIQIDYGNRIKPKAKNK